MFALSLELLNYNARVFFLRKGVCGVWMVADNSTIIRVGLYIIHYILNTKASIQANIPMNTPFYHSHTPIIAHARNIAREEGCGLNSTQRDK